MDHYQVASGKDLAEHIARTESSEWRKAVQNELVVLHILNNENEENPRKALEDIIAWNQKIALDPAVSQEARDLVESGANKARPITLVKFDNHYINPEKVAALEGNHRQASVLLGATWYTIAGPVNEVAKRLGLVKGERE